MLWLYRIFSGGTVVRPLAWLLAIDAAAYFLYARAARPEAGAVGRYAGDAWTWTKSLFKKAPASAATDLSGDQHRALFEFWWAAAVPLGTVSDRAYDRAVTLLFGPAGMPWHIHALQAAQIALTAVLVLLIGLSIRNRVRAALAGYERERGSDEN
jgi:hypothetical protein